MTDEVDELLHEDELEIPIPDDLEAEAEGLRVEEFGTGDLDRGFDTDLGSDLDTLDPGTEDEADELDEESRASSVMPGDAARPESASEGDAADDDEDLEGLPEDPEATLDEILRAQLGGGDDEEGFVTSWRADAEEDRATRELAFEDGGAEPRHGDEFACRSCFLVKNHNQLADAERQLCRDCA